jgi:IclR family transcriptional regulator, acetate operon repressor
MDEHTGVVQSLDRALRLLEVLSDADVGFRLVDLARRAELPVSTTHRLLLTLESRRFVQFDRARSLWSVGASCLSVGANFQRRRALASQALPYMDALSREAGQTINLGVVDDGSVVFVTQVEHNPSQRATARPGGRSPLHCSGIGKSLLAAMPDGRVRQLLARHGMPKVTANSITDSDAFCEALRAVRSRGFALDDQENTSGLRCVASTIYGEYGQPLAAISIAAPTAQMGDVRIAELGRLVSQAATAITEATGGHRPVFGR